MKSIAVIVGLCCTLQMWAQGVEDNVYTFSGGNIQVSSKFQESSNIGDLTDITPYVHVGTTSFVSNSKIYDLEFLNYKGCENDGGDFRVIRLCLSGKLILEFIDDEAWIGNPQRVEWCGFAFERFKEDAKSFASFRNYCTVYPIENNATAILFEGFSWSSQVPLLTVIVVKDGKAKVVFNKSYEVENFNAYSKGFELTLIDKFRNSYDANLKVNTYKLYTTSEGTMKFKKIE